MTPTVFIYHPTIRGKLKKAGNTDPCDHDYSQPNFSFDVDDEEYSRVGV